jgi:UDP-N-acetylglucosamine transferase subunit ALG13
MIFATVGTQLPFDRMIGAIDKWQSFQKDTQCFAQVGAKGQAPEALRFAATLTPAQFAKHIAECKVVVSHAGMGTILSALGAGKPIIVMPRLARYGEHRNDHQLATVANLRGRPGIHVARDEVELFDHLDRLATLEAGTGLSSCASSELLDAVARFIRPGQKELCHAV